MVKAVKGGPSIDNITTSTDKWNASEEYNDG